MMQCMKTRTKKENSKIKRLPKRMGVVDLFAPLKSSSISKRNSIFYSHWLLYFIIIEFQRLCCQHSSARPPRPNLAVAWFFCCCVYYNFTQRQESTVASATKGALWIVLGLDCCLHIFISHPDSFRTFNWYDVGGRWRAHPCRPRKEHVW